MEITDRASFAEFIGELRTSLEAEPSAWENADLPRFLEAMQAYTQDLQGYYDNVEAGQSADNPSWKTFADILSGARVYE